MPENTNTVAKVANHQKVTALTDELFIIRRLLGRPELCAAPVMDAVRMAVDYTHSRFESLATDMRRAADVKQNVPEDAYYLFRDGNKWCAVRPNFINLQELPAGFGDTPESAMSNLFTQTNADKRSTARSA